MLLRFVAASLLVGGLAAAERNALIIIADDLGNHLGCYGDRTVPTPNLDRLAAQGTRFTRAHVVQPSCSPSRAGIHTGLHPHQNRQLGLAPYGFAIRADLPTLPLLAKRAGLRTGFFGKLHLAPEASFPLDVFAGGFDSPVKWPQADVRNCTKLGEETASFVGQPGGFLLTVNLIDPHTPWLRQVDGVPAKPLLPGATLPTWTWTTDPGPELVDYYNCVARLDVAVGRLLDALDASGKADDTLVVFISDNGPSVKRAKCTLYEQGTRVPFLVRMPGTPAGLTSDALVSSLDIYPTVLQWLRIATPPFAGPVSEGRDLAPLLRGETPADWRTLLFTAQTFHQWQHYNPQRAVRDARWKLYWSRRHDGSEHEELYDLVADPDEHRDLAADPAHAAERTRLRSALDDWRRRTGDPVLDEAMHAAFARVPVQPDQPVQGWYQPSRKLGRWAAISAPRGGEVAAGAAVTVTANVGGGTCRSVEFSVDGRPIGVATKAPWSVTWTPATTGPAALSAVANFGGRGVEAWPVRMTVTAAGAP